MTLKKIGGQVELTPRGVTRKGVEQTGNGDGRSRRAHEVIRRCLGEDLHRQSHQC